MKHRDDLQIRLLGADEVESRSGDLGRILADAVAAGASVNFMAGFSEEEGRAFWLAQVAGVRAGDKQLVIAERGAQLLGTVILTLAHQPNAPHRADIGKMLVLSSARRQGIGRRLLMAAEAVARDAGRTLLLLDTETGSAGDHLYRRCGWRAVGGIPDHAYAPDGRLAETTIFYKVLGEHRKPPAIPYLVR